MKEVGAEFGEIGQRRGGVRGAEEEAGAVGGAVEDAGVGGGFGDLLEGFGDGFFARAGEFVFPANDFGVWKPLAEFGENFGGGFEGEGEVFGAGGEFGGGDSLAGGVLDGGDFEIGEGGGVEDGVDFFGGELLEFLGEVVVGSEGNCSFGAEKSWVGGLFAFKADDVVAGVREGIGEGDAEPASGEVGDAADLVDGFVAGAAGDDDVHRARGGGFEI